MGNSYSYPASYLREAGQDPRFDGSTEQALSKRSLTVDDSGALVSLEELALTNENQRQFQEAAELRERALVICEEALGSHHPITLQALQKLTNVYECQAEYQKAERLYDRVLSNPRIQQSVQAVQYLEQALVARNISLGEKHTATLSLTSKLSTCYKTLGRRNEGAKLDKRVYETRRQVFGEGAPATLQSAAQLAESYTRLGQLQEAADLEKIILAARRRSLGIKHPDTQQALENLAITYSNLGRQNDACELQELAVRSREESLGDAHPATIQAQYNLAQSYRTLGRDQESAELESKCRLFLQECIESLNLGPKVSEEDEFIPFSPMISISQGLRGVSDTAAKQMIEVFSPVKDSWLPLLATLDLDSSKNCISSHAIDLLQLAAQSEELIQYLALNGQATESQKTVSGVLWHGYDNQRVRKMEFHVIEDADFDILLGSDFVFSEAIRSFDEPSRLLEIEGARLSIFE